MKNRITAEQCVRALKSLGISSTAKTIAELLGSDSRAVATAMRKPTNDGRVNIRFKKGIGHYRFVRLTPNTEGGTA